MLNIDYSHLSQTRNIEMRKQPCRFLCTAPCLQTRNIKMRKQPCRFLCTAPCLQTRNIKIRKQPCRFLCTAPCLQKMSCRLNCLYSSKKLQHTVYTKVISRKVNCSSVYFACTLKPVYSGCNL